MRTIKFRAWSEEYKEMYASDFDDFVMPENTALFNSGLDSDGKLFCGHYLENGDFEDLVLMQYTGLKDKNGIEIFESYFVKNPFGTKYRVVFNNGCFELHNGTSLNYYSLEIIGNIHENKELLER